jgi:hypothetical protein
MSVLADLSRRVRELYEGARMLVEIVTDVDLDGFGVGTAKGLDDDDDDKLEVQVLGAYAFRSRPRVGAAGGVVLRLFDDPDTVFLLGYGNREWELTALKEGEAIIETEKGARILLDENGGIEQVPKAGQKIRLGGSSGLEPAPLGQTLLSRIEAIESFLSGHVHSGGTISGKTGAPDGAPSSYGDDFLAENVELK